METFFELVICLLVSYKFLKIRDFWKTPEYIVYYLQWGLAIILVVFIFIALRFLFFKFPKMIRLSMEAGKFE